MKGLFSIGDLPLRRIGRSKRISSWDKTGANHDWIPFEPRERKILAEVSGAGCIRHIWFTINHRDRLYLRKMVLRAWWDGENTPSIETPVGDFFCIGHGIAKSFQNAVFNTVTSVNNESCLGGGVALNCYFPMPFEIGMRIEIENESDERCDSFYYYVDYEELDHLEEGMLRFHAQYRQEMPTKVEGGTIASRGENYWMYMEKKNLTGRENYVILEAKGTGHYVGCNLSIHNIDPTVHIKRFGDEELKVPELTWWGEGDDMFFIDGESWPPSLHGTGSEDYFTQAWGMHDHAYLYAGVSIYEHDPRFPERHATTCYRLHLLDPVIFQKSILFSIEHGHANLQQNDYSSVAYWYQTEPHAAFPILPPAEERIPRFAKL